MPSISTTPMVNVTDDTTPRPTATAADASLVHAAAPGERESSVYARMEAALDWLSEHFERQPSLAEAAAVVDLSPSHFQRLFARMVGLSPKQYVQVLTLERAKASLDHSRSVLDAALESGLSGPGRLHDLFVTIESLTPGEYKRRGEGLSLGHGLVDSPFGECLLTHTERGVASLSFLGQREPEAALAEARRGWERAALVADQTGATRLAERIFAPDQAPSNPSRPLRLLVRGTSFQTRVWRALLEIPPGSVTSYEDLARRIDAPTSTRAVARAVGTNPVGWLIPCHRVIRKSGSLSGYRWGTGRKLAMLTREMALHDIAA